MIRLGLVQATAAADVEKNLETLTRFAWEGRDAGCEAVCFPECFLTGYRPETAADTAISGTGPELAAVSAVAVETGVDLLVGFAERWEAGISIAHGLFRRDGTREIYRKTHLGKKESRYFLPGDRLEVVSLSCGLRMGWQMCVETHFPEITQTLALKGAEVIFAPHGAPRVSGPRQQIWGKYIPARSYDNRVYMACCNLWDPERFGGGCLVTDPRGEIQTSCYEEKEALLTFAVDRELLARYRTPGDKRSTHYYPGKRRKELYW